MGDVDVESRNEVDGPVNETDETGVIPRCLKMMFRSLDEETAKGQQSSAKELQTAERKENKENINGDDSVPPSQKSLGKSSSLAVMRPFEYSIKVRFLELYGEEIMELISTECENPADWSKMNDTVSEYSYKRNTRTTTTQHLTIRDGKAGEDAEVVGICQAKVKSATEALNYMYRGMKMRRTAFTKMNAQSSRSHAIFTVIVQQIWRTKTSMETTGTSDNNTNECSASGVTVEMKTSKIHFVDLAGSERLKRTQHEG